MAQADTSIYNALLQPAKSALDWQSAYAAQDDARQARQMNALQLQSTQGKLQDESQVRADQAAYRSVLAGLPANATLDDQIAAAQGTRNPYGMSQAQALRKAQLDSTKTTAEIGHLGAQTTAQAAIAGKNAAETQALQLKAETEKHDKAIGEIMSFGSPAEALASLQKHAAEGSIGQQEVQGISRQLMGLSTPEQWQQWQDQTLYKLQDAKGKAELRLKRLDYQLRRDNQVSEVANRNLIPGAAPGQFVPNAPLIEAKKQIAQAGATQVPGMTYMNDASGNIVGLPTKAPLGKTVVANVVTDANRAPLPGKDAGLNDSQSKALLFGTRMQEADRILNDMSSKGVDRPSTAKVVADSVPLVGGALGAVANARQSPNQQMVEQAQRDFVNAVLRRESGAAISPGEFDSAAKQYFPSIGDSPQVKAQKSANRQLAIQGLLAEVPQGKRGSITPGKAGAAPSTKTAPSGPAKVINFEDL